MTPTSALQARGGLIDVVGRGWIGTSALQTGVLASYLKAAVYGRRSVVLAVESAAYAVRTGRERRDLSPLRPLHVQAA